MRLFTYAESTRIDSGSQNLRFTQAASLIFTTCLLFLASHRMAPAQTVHIPDPNLRTALELALGKVAGADITRAEMAGLEVLEAIKSGILDLKGLEFAANLKRLELGDNRISDLAPLKDLKNLTRLRLGANYKISDISPLKDLKNLTFLDIDSNKIKDLSPLKDLKNLTFLDLDDNGISDLSPLKDLKNLRYLDLDGNVISDLSPLKDLKNLTFLDLDENDLSDSDISILSVLTKLTVLDIEGNKISNISPLSTLINLTELDVHDNAISDLSPLRGLVRLKVLDLRGNAISDLSPLRGLVRLKVLDLRGNAISDFSPIAGLIGNLDEYYTDAPIKVLADVNRDGVVNIIDLVLVALNYRNPDLVVLAQRNIYPDATGDGVVDVRDLVAVAAELDAALAAPALKKDLPGMSNFTIVNLTQWIILAKQLSGQEPYIQKGVAVLQHLLTALRFVEGLPQETALFTNYPNPFNPETWIPYQLAKPAEVRIFIHSSDGKLVRSLVLGQLSAGVYSTKSRAAYWDGRNELGEAVASGIYFYTLTADDFTGTGKMFIRK